MPSEVGKIGNNSPSFVLPVKERKDGIANFFKKQTGEGVPVKTSDSSPKAKHNLEGKLPVKRQHSGEVKVPDDAHVDEKPRTNRAKQVHSPASTPKLDLKVEAEQVSDSSPDRNTDLPPTKKEENEFETGIGDDSNAPNPKTPRGGKGKGKTNVASPEVAIVSPRQTRSSVQKTISKHEDVSPRITRKRKHPIPEVVSEEDEIQVISSPETSRPRKKTPAAASKSSGTNETTVEAKVNESVPRERKAKGATTQGGTGEEGLESTVCAACVVEP